MRVAFAGFDGSIYGIYVTDIDGGFTRRLTQEGVFAIPGSWSRDGGWIYFYDGSSKSQIWKIPAVGGEPLQLTKKGGWSPRESEDGQFLYYVDKEGTIRRVPVGGGEELPVMGGQKTFETKWTLWRNHIVYLHEDNEKKYHLELFDLETRQVTRLFSFEPEPFWDIKKPSGGFWTGVTVSPGGRWVLVSVVPPRTSDIMLVENFH
jgi:Tol biopolymer transport system component